MKSYLQKLAVTGAILGGVLTTASAQILYNANGWESTGTPSFVVGPLCNTASPNPFQQDGWTELQAGVDGVNNPITVATMLGSTNVTPRSGNQMHRSMSSTSFNNHFVWKELGAAYAARTPGNNTIVVRTDVFMPSFYAASDHEHGIFCFSPNGAVFLGGFTVFNSGIFDGVSYNRGFILYGGGLIGADGGVILNNTMPRDTWVRVVTVLDFDNAQVEAYINGVQVVFALNSDNVFRTGWPMGDAAMAPFNDADITSLPNATTSSSSVFTDNYQVSAVRSVRFEGRIRLEDVPNFEDALGNVFAAIELRDSAGNPLTGQQAVQLIEPDTNDPTAGYYSVRAHNVPNGNYKLYIKGLRHLSRVVNVTVSGPGPVTVPTVTLFAGDANNDDSADVLDLDLLVQAFDTVRGDPNYRPGVDFDYSDSVDVLDLDALIRHFDQVGEGF